MFVNCCGTPKVVSAVSLRGKMCSEMNLFDIPCTSTVCSLLVCSLGAGEEPRRADLQGALELPDAL